MKNAPKTTARVLIVDDHPAIRDAVAAAITSRAGMELVAAADSAADAMRLIEKHRPNVAVVDLSLSDMHGLDLVQNIRALFTETKVVIFSMYDERVFAERALRAGASAYLMKSEPTERLCEAICSVQQGEIYLSARMYARMLGRLALMRTNPPTTLVDELTDREMTVMQMLGEGYSLEAIALRLSLSRKTAETYRRRAREKLALDTVDELIHFAAQWVHRQASMR